MDWFIRILREVASIYKIKHSCTVVGMLDLGLVGANVWGPVFRPRVNESTLVQTTGPRTPLRLVEKEDILYGDVSLSEYVLDECVTLSVMMVWGTVCYWLTIL